MGLSPIRAYLNDLTDEIGNGLFTVHPVQRPKNKKPKKALKTET
jgi:hypothetical protein